MSSSPDLDAYFARIGYAGSRAPTVATLAALQFRHVCTFPFENLDLHLGRPIRLDLPSLEQKLVHGRRGGYCFEQNTLLQAVLTALGFRVTPLIARVRWQVPPEVETAQTHMVLLVEVDGRPHLVDGGFGSGSLSAPLLLDTTAEQPTPHESRRIVRRDDLFAQQIRVGDDWADLYLFSLRPALAIDYEAANWFTSTWPQSRFLLNVTAALTGDGFRHTLLNREFTTRWVDGRVERRELSGRAELLTVLSRAFTLSLPADTRFGPLIAAWPE